MTSKTALLIGLIVIFFIGGFAVLSFSKEGLNVQDTQEEIPANIPAEKPPQEPPVPPVSENHTGEADPSRMTLTMTNWVWQSAQLAQGEELRPNTPGAFVLSFAGVFDGTGGFSAKTDCNSMSGTVSVANGTITFSNIASTKMFCEHSQESEFLSLLQEATRYHFTSRGELVLELDGGGTARFR